MLLFFVYTYINAPSKEEMAERQRVIDSIALAEQTIVATDSLLISDDILSTTETTTDSLSVGNNQTLDTISKHKSSLIFFLQAAKLKQ